jgi:preprotein translocase subunit SecF
MMRLRLVPESTNIDFMRYTRFWLVVSVIGVLGSLALLATKGLNYGVDFRGGTLIMATTPEPEPVAAFRETLNALGFGEAGVTEISDDTGEGRHLVLMRLGIAGEDPDSQQAVIGEVRAALEADFPGIEFLQVDSVGAKVSGELVRAGALAVLLSFLGIMVYIWLRFEWQFALGAVLSLIHDAIVTMGVFSLMSYEFNLTIVAAILTVIGYSINDTVVVFDRMRENLRKFKKMPLKDVMNLALNETLSRTVMTSLTTLIALFAIFWFSGPVVHGFAFAVIFGVVIGTYSSIYVAGATVLWLGVKRDWSKADPSGAPGTRFGKTEA